MSEWVKVSDRLPKNGEYVLTYMPEFNEMLVLKFHEYVYFGKSNFVWSLLDDEFEWQLEEVSAWIPLPKEPEDG